MAGVAAVEAALRPSTGATAGRTKVRAAARANIVKERKCGGSGLGMKEVVECGERQWLMCCCVRDGE